MAYSTSTIAQGCFGKVYKEKYNDTWAAIKKVPHHLISRKDLERECDVYKWVKIPTCPKYMKTISFYFILKGEKHLPSKHINKWTLDFLRLY